MPSFEDRRTNQELPMPATPIPRQPEITETEARMLDLAHRHTDKHGYPTGDLAVRRLVHALQPAIPVPRPPDTERPGPRTARERALAVAALPVAVAAEEPAEPEPAPAALPVPVRVPVLSPGLMVAVDRLLAIPEGGPIAELIAEGRSNAQIAEALGLPFWRVKRLAGKWFQASGQYDRSEVGPWLRRTGVLGAAGVEPTAAVSMGAGDAPPEALGGPLAPLELEIKHEPILGPSGPQMAVQRLADPTGVGR